MNQVFLHTYSIKKEDQPDYEELASFLSADERERASRFHFEHLQENFTVARGMLRKILGEWLSAAPNGIEFEYTKYGKPFLKGTHPKFNLSHTDEIAILGITVGREIGVDVEDLRKEVPEANHIVQRFFSENEIAAFNQIPAQQKGEAFFNCWTRKEAYIKAIGEGLSHPLDTFDVSLTPGDPARLLTVRGDAKEAERWKLISLNPVPTHVAAVIAEGQDWELVRA